MTYLVFWYILYKWKRFTKIEIETPQFDKLNWIFDKLTFCLQVDGGFLCIYEKFENEKIARITQKYIKCLKYNK